LRIKGYISRESLEKFRIIDVGKSKDLGAIVLDRFLFNTI